MLVLLEPTQSNSVGILRNSGIHLLYDFPNMIFCSYDIRFGGVQNYPGSPGSGLMLPALSKVLTIRKKWKSLHHSTEDVYLQILVFVQLIKNTLANSLFTIEIGTWKGAISFYRTWISKFVFSMIYECTDSQVKQSSKTVTFTSCNDVNN